MEIDDMVCNVGEVLTALLLIATVSFFIVGLITIGHALWDFSIWPTNKRKGNQYARRTN